MAATPLPLLLAALPLADPAPAPEPPLVLEAALSAVATSGNARGQNLGADADLTWRRGRSTLAAQGRAARVTAVTVERSAVGASPGDYDYRERETSAVTTENVHLDLRLDRRLRRDRLYGFAAAGWARDLPAGLDHHLEVLAGAGRIWSDGAGGLFRTDLGLGCTYETPRFARLRARSGYPTGNLTARFRRRLGTAGDYQADLAYGIDLADRRDYQASLRQALKVAVTGHLSLKVGLDYAYRNQPNLVPVPIQSRTDPAVTVGTAGVPARRTDATFTTGLAVTFR